MTSEVDDHPLLGSIVMTKLLEIARVERVFLLDDGGVAVYALLEDGTPTTELRPVPACGPYRRHLGPFDIARGILAALLPVIEAKHRA